MSAVLDSQSCPMPVLNPSHLPDFALYQPKDSESAVSGVGWQLSPEPFALTQAQYSQIEVLGEALWSFLKACDVLVRKSRQGLCPTWVETLLYQGKPEALLQFSEMNRFKSQLPLVIRPDLLITETGFALTEIDSVPGGIGFTSALNHAYRQSGFNVIEPVMAMPEAFLAMLKSQAPHLENPVIALVVSDEAGDYRPEMQWLVTHLQAHYPHIHLVHPRALALNKDRLVLLTEVTEGQSSQEIPIDIVYRFFELFDLPNIPNIELLQYAMKKKWVVCTPPFKPVLEEKLLLTLFHHPALKSYWQKELAPEYRLALEAVIPPGWVIDPTPLPPQAVIPNLTPAGEAIQSFETLKPLSQKQRQLVLKPSGFSPLAWGSRGVTVGHDVNGEEWGERVEQALAAYQTNPYILQRFETPKTLPIKRLQSGSTGQTESFMAKVRLCPYFMIQDDKPVLAGILATACPADKKIIHGMKDAVLAPCQIAPH